MIIIINNIINILIWYIDHTIIQMIEDAYLDAKTFGNSLLLLERYFLSVPALIRLNEWIRLYSYRFRIECTFKELKQQTGAFC